MDRNLYKWRVKVKNFPENLAIQLVLYASQWDADCLTLEISFDGSYPMVPPKLRIVEPRFTPDVIPWIGVGGVVESPLFRDGGDWTPICTVESCITEVVGKLRVSCSGKPDTTHFFEQGFRSQYTAAEALSQRTGFMKCYRAISVEDEGAELGGKIALPASALEEISRAENAEFPLIFELKQTRMSSPDRMRLGQVYDERTIAAIESSGGRGNNHSIATDYEELQMMPQSNLKRTFAGVSTFDAIEGCALVPSWIMENLGIFDGDPITARMVSLPKGDLVVLQPHDPQTFLSMEQPKEALESVLKSFVALQRFDLLHLSFEGVLHQFTIINTLPASAIDIRDTDLRLEIRMPEDFDVEAYERSRAETSRTSNLEQVVNDSNTSSSSSSNNNQIDTVTCTNCKKGIPKNSIVTHEVFCKRHNVVCEQCENVIRASDRVAHEEEVHRRVNCVCGDSLEIRFLALHKLQECLHRPHACKYCKLKKKLVDLPDHQEYCGSRTEKCSKCQKFVSIKDYQFHLQSNCSYPPPPEDSSLFGRIKGIFG